MTSTQCTLLALYSAIKLLGSSLTSKLLAELRQRQCRKGVAIVQSRQTKSPSCTPGQQGATCQRQESQSAGYKSVRKKKLPQVGKTMLCRCKHARKLSVEP